MIFRRGWFKLFGPVLGYDLVRTARRGRFFWLRLGYAVAILFLLLAVYVHNQDTSSMRGLVRRGTIAQFAEGFFFAFTCVQVSVVILLTPIYASGAIAEEKESGTLEYLLATDLRSREIILSKLVSRLANLTLLILTGLPILGLVQLLGGVDPDLVLMVYAATGLTLMSLTSLSVLLSVYVPKSRDAMILTYLVMAAYVGTASLGLLLIAWPQVALFPLTGGDEPLEVKDLVEALNIGNPLGAWNQLREALSLGKPLAAVMPALLGRYALCHAAVTLICVAWAVVRLRAVAMKQSPGAVNSRPPRFRFLTRPRVRNLPMVWKEVFIERGFSSTWFGRIILTIIFLASFAPLLWFVADYVFDITDKGMPWLRKSVHPSYRSYYDSQILRWLRDSINKWVRLVGTLVACLSLLGVAARAASSVSGERDRQTYDNLLTSPLSGSAILFGKWLGSVLSVRWAWLWLCLIWLLGVWTNALNFFTVPWLALCCAVYAAFVAMLGLWFSVVCRTTLRATLWTLAATAILGVGNGLLWMTFGLMGLFPSSRKWGEIVTFQMYGLTPPMALSWFAFHGDDMDFKVLGFGWDSPMQTLDGIFEGLLFWAIAGGLLWVVTCLRFDTLAGRSPLSQPARSPDNLAELPIQVPAPKAGLRNAARTAGHFRWRRLAWTAALAVLAALGLGVGWYARLAWTADRDLEEALADADRQDPAWRWEDLRNQRASVQDDENASIPVTAMSKLPSGNPKWGNMTSIDSPFLSLAPERQLNAQQIAELSQALAPAGAALAKASELDHCSTGRFDLQEGEEVWLWPPRSIHPVFRAAELLRWQAFLQAQQGNADGAVTSCSRIIIVARAYGDEPLLSSQARRLEYVHTAATVVERVLAQGQPSEESLAALQRLLEDEDNHRGLLIAVRSERAIIDRGLEALQTGEVTRAQVSGRGSTTSEAFRRVVLPGYMKHERAAVLRYLTNNVRTVQLSGDGKFTKFEELEKGKGPRAPAIQPLQQRIDELVMSLKPLCEAKAKMGCALVGVACERYRLRHGRWPASLDALVQAQLLSEIPNDPFHEGTLRLQRLADGLLIDSRERERNRLRGLRFWGLPLEGTPLGFRLWDVDKRRQPPAPMAANP